MCQILEISYPEKMTTKLFTQTKWLDQLRRGKSIYQFRELQRLAKLSEVATQRAVHRLSRAHLLAKLGKGFYANLLQPPLIEEVSAVLYPPSYISLESALFHHGIIEQAPQMQTCVSANKTKTFQTAFGGVYYARVQPKLFFGYELNGRSFMRCRKKRRSTLFICNCRTATHRRSMNGIGRRSQWRGFLNFLQNFHARCSDMCVQLCPRNCASKIPSKRFLAPLQPICYFALSFCLLRDLYLIAKN